LERALLKKITLSLNLGIVGLNTTAQNIEKNVFLDYLKDYEIKSDIKKPIISDSENYEFLVIFNEIPIKVKIFFFKDINAVISRYDKVKSLDIIVLTFNVYDINSINLFQKEIFNEFKEYYTFRGISVLTGLNVDSENSSKKAQIDADLIMNKVRELELIYGFELKDEEKDIIDFYNKILSDFIFKFQVSAPELVDLSKSYGKELLDKLK
jgi:hypothetical protein